MKKFSILKLVCMLLCSFSLFAACASSGGSNSGGSSNDSGTNTGSGTGTGTGSGTGTGTGTGGGSDSGSGSGSGMGGSSEDPNDYGIIKDYNPYISPTKRHIIATEYLNCSTKYFITESGEVYSDYYSSQYNNYKHNRLNIFDKSNNTVTDNVKIVSGECINGSREAILLSNEGKYYKTAISYNSSKELTFKKGKDTFYAESEEVKFGNVEYKGSSSDYYSFKDGVIHFWKATNEEETFPIKVSGNNFFVKIIFASDIKTIFALSNSGDIYKLNKDTMEMEKLTVTGDVLFDDFDLYYGVIALSKAGDIYLLNNDTNEFQQLEIYHKTGSSYDFYDKDSFTQSSNIKFKAIYSDGHFLSTDNKLYQFKSSKGKVYKIAAKNSDNSYNDDLTLTQVFEKGTQYSVDYSGAIQKSVMLLGKDSSGNYYDLSNYSYNAYVSQVTNIVDSSDIIFNYYSSSYFLTFFKTADGLEVMGESIYGQLGIGRDYKGVIGTTDGERKKVLFPESDGNIDVKKMWMIDSYFDKPIFAYTDKGIYTWGMNSTGANNPAKPAKVMAYKITAFPSGMGTVYGTHDCDLTLTATEASNLNIKDTRGNIFITEDGRAFRKYSGNLNFKKDGWRYYYECASEGVIANSFLQLDLGEGVIAKGFVDSYYRVMTNIGILEIYDSDSSYNNYFNKWSETEGTIEE